MIPRCYDPVYQAEQREAAYDYRMKNRPVCVDCRDHIESEMCLPVKNNGSVGYICEACIQRRMIWTDDLEVDE